MTSQKKLRVGLLGFGTVGQGVYRMLENNTEAITSRIGFPVEVVKIGVKDGDKSRSVDRSLITTDLHEIVNNPGIDVVVELIGGLDPATELVEQALKNGKSVVTANKELMAKQGARLVQLAKDRRIDMHYEAAVGGGIPLVQPLKHQLAGNEVLKMVGILNGTTNYILTKMTKEGSQFDEVLKEAQKLGYAEADPTNDVDGFDSSYKLAILSSIAFGCQVPIESVYREGIRSIKAEDLTYAGVLGYRIKLLGIVEQIAGKGILARIHPTFIRETHQIAKVDGVYNAVWINGDFVGDLMFSGKGAGGDPTASAVVGDLIDVGRNIAAEGPGSAIPISGVAQTATMDDLVSAYYVRMRVRDEAKVLGRISMVFGDMNVSLAAMEMRVIDETDHKGEIVFLTHACREPDLIHSLARITEESLATSIESWFRVED